MSADTNLPHEIIHKLTDPLSRFLKIQAAAGILLLFSAVAAIVLTNSSWGEPFQSIWNLEIGFQIGSYRMGRSLHHWINDGLMTVFFFVVALEMKREIILGELRSLRMAMLPLAGAIGGMLFPALTYIILMKGEPEIHGWGTVMATDTAFMIGCLALLGARLPANLRLFLLSLAIFDDIGAILVVAFGYGDPPNWFALGLGLFGFGLVWIASRLGVRSVPIYSLIGVAIWACFDSSGLHPTLVGVILGLMTPTMEWISDERLRSIFGKVLAYPPGAHWSGDTADRDDLRQAGAAAREALSPVERLEMRLHPWVGFVVMPIFALANAGVVLPKTLPTERVSWAIVISLVCGKPIGIFILSRIAVRFGIARLFPNLKWSFVAAGGMLTGIGFTMSLFIAELAFTPSSLAFAKIGILAASTISATVGTLTLFWISSPKFVQKIRKADQGVF